MKFRINLYRSQMIVKRMRQNGYLIQRLEQILLKINARNVKIRNHGQIRLKKTLTLNEKTKRIAYSERIFHKDSNQNSNPPQIFIPK